MWQQWVYSRYLNGSLPYVRGHITVNKNVFGALLNRTQIQLEVTMQMAESQGKSEIRLKASGFKGLTNNLVPTFRTCGTVPTQCSISSPAAADVD